MGRVTFQGSRKDRPHSGRHSGGAKFGSPSPQNNAGGGGDRANRGGSGSDSKVFVGNLPYDLTWQSLKDHMRKAGNVRRVEILTDRSTGRSKGCGTAEYFHPKEASRAVRELNGVELEGREIYVKHDDDPRERGTGAKRGGADGGESSGPPSAPRLFVGNLSYETSWQDLKDFMREAGNVVRADVLQGPDGRSKGCGIVEYEHPKDARRALEELNERELNGRTVYVQEDRGGRSGGGGRGVADDDETRRRLYVGNLSWSTKWYSLKDHFKAAGDVEYAEVVEDSATGKSRGFGTVKFADSGDAQRAIETLNGTELDGRTIYVRLDQRA